MFLTFTILLSIAQLSYTFLKGEKKRRKNAQANLDFKK